MFEISQEFNRARRDRGLKPVLLFSLVNAFGQRVYASRHPATKSWAWPPPPWPTAGSWPTARAAPGRAA